MLKVRASLPAGARRRLGGRGPAKHIRRVAHHGRVDEFAVAAYCAEAVGLGAVVVLHDRVRIGDFASGGGEDVVGDGDLVGVDRPVAVEAQQAGMGG